MRVLTHRQQEIIKVLCRGNTSNKEIAKTLGIQTNTVKRHIEDIIVKLKVKDRTQIALIAIKEGWIDIDEIFIQGKEDNATYRDK
jgi:DNA-binding NarL/FixJ family response regulator